jgi:hypothetical protein
VGSQNPNSSFILHPSSSPYKLGTRVRHAKYGSGTVVFTSGAGKSLKARVRFDTGRMATFLVAAAPLEIERKK